MLEKFFKLNVMIINSVLLKITNRCNLNCKYCYMYNLEDKSFKTLLGIMPEEVAILSINKFYEHCIENNIKEFLFVFHGGEPLMQKKEFFIKFVNYAHEVFDSNVIVYFAIQSNGTLLNADIAKLFADLKIQIGVSIDGDKKTNDENRLYKNGKSSFYDVINGIQNCFSYTYHKQTLGILTVINLNTAPKIIYDFYKTLDIRNIDFNLPYYTHETYPYIDKLYDANFTPYGDWLINLFDLWFYDENHPNIRLFSGFIRCFFGIEFPNDLFGSFPNGLLVVQPNGDLEPIDYLSACGEGITKIGYNVHNNSISDVQKNKIMKLYYNSHTLLPTICSSCAVRDICGGTNIAARYSKEKGFNNCSIYCKDILQLLAHIQKAIIGTLDKNILQRINFEILNYTEEIEKIFSQKNYYNKILSSYKF